MDLKIGDKVLYFFLTIIILSSIGITMPVITDLLGADSKITNDTLFSIPSNITTYYVSVLFIAVLDRILKKVIDKECEKKQREVLITICVILGIIGITILTFKQIILANKNISSFNYKVALWISIIMTGISYIAWWFANHDKNSNPNNAIGGEI